LKNRHCDENLWVDDDFMVLESNLQESRFVPPTGRGADLGGFKKLKKGRSRKFDNTKQFENIRQTYFNKLSEALLEDVSTQELRDIVEGAYLTAYAQGILNSSLKTKRSVRSVLEKLTQEERNYIGKAVAQEMQYLIKFDSVLDEAGRDEFVIGDRVKMYVKSLNGVYGSGRVRGLNPSTFITWTPGSDSVKEDRCESCKYLIKHSPFLPDNLPTTPRAGDTRCLFNCKDVLVVKEVTAEDEQSLRESSLTAEEHRSKLANLQSNRKAKA
jgi:hypothetical protein